MNHHQLDLPIHLNDHRQLGRKLRYQAYCLGRKTAFRHLFLEQKPSEWALNQTPLDVGFSGDTEKGEKITEDKFLCSDGKIVNFHAFISQNRPEKALIYARVAKRTIQELQSFSWLADLHAYAFDQDKQAQPAQSLLDTEDRLGHVQRFCIDILSVWCARHSQYTPLSWHIPTLARRINAWLHYRNSLFSRWSGNKEVLLLRSLSRQIHHLRLCVVDETQGFERIYGLICWVNASLSLQSETLYLEEGKLLLSIALHQQLHQSRSSLMASSGKLVEVLNLMKGLNDGFKQRKVDVPKDFLLAQKRIKQILQNYQLTTHHLAGSLGTHAHYTATSNRHQSHTTFDENNLPLKRIEHHGFTLMFDASPYPKDDQQYHHASVLGIELADKGDLLFIHARPPMLRSELIEDAYRRAPAHSTIYVKELDWVKISQQQFNSTYEVQFQAIQENQQVWINAEHDGLMRHYPRSGGILSRQLYFLPDNLPERSIRGQDTLELPEKFNPKSFKKTPLTLVSQFHLPPSIEVTPLAGGAMLLHNQKKTLSWHFSVHGEASLSLINDTVHYDAHNQPIMLKTLSIQLKIMHPNPTQQYSIQWQLNAQMRK